MLNNNNLIFFSLGLFKNFFGVDVVDGKGGSPSSIFRTLLQCFEISFTKHRVRIIPFVRLRTRNLSKLDL